ncbi:ATP-binding protein [Emergencia sp.]|uniref:ATP-binding protein n=1 Tax=Emergencia sp. TaxID=1926557 RepID=UPI003AF1DEF9
MKNEYLPRIVDKLLAERLEAVGAVLLVGPKWCGKTTTAQQQARSVLKLQDPDKTKGYLATAEVKPSLLLKGENPRLIDEWRMAPVLWDAVRNTVDERGEEGLFILTGSTVVDETSIMHSGTGRISRLVMLPMSLFESRESNGAVSLAALFEEPELDIDGVMSELTVEALVFAACRGGWPSSLKKKTEKAALFEAENYVNNICDTDAGAVDGTRRNPERVRAVLQSYSRNISTLASDKTILQDVAASYSDITAPTLAAYLDALEKLYVISDIPAWCPSIRSATAMRSGRKKEFIDPSIAAAALGLTPEGLLLDLNTFGFIFECLCIRDLKAYATALGGHVSYYHDRYGLEADCVLHLADGRYALIEFKLGTSGIEEGAEHLLKLQELIKAAQIREPSLLMVITGGEMAYTRKDGVKIIPIGTLKN